MKIKIETACYNERRYSAPWIAKISLENNKFKYEFGRWVGRAGDKGLLVAEVEPGQIVAKGQKDIRGGNNTSNNFFKVMEDGSLRPVTTVEAFEILESI